MNQIKLFESKKIRRVLHKAIFEMKPSQHKKLKGLRNENLCHHLTNLESVFSMLGEASITAIVKTRRPKGFIENKKAARQGGTVAGNARRELEMKTGQKVVTVQNYLTESEKKKIKVLAAASSKKKGK